MWLSSSRKHQMVNYAGAAGVPEVLRPWRLWGTLKWEASAVVSEDRALSLLPAFYTCLERGKLQMKRHFFCCSKQFLNSLILMHFSASPIFLFHLFTSAKYCPLRTFFIQENKKSCSGRDRVNREGGTQGACHFFKNCWTQHGVGRCARKAPMMKWANRLKNSSKKIHWSRTEPLTTPPVGTLLQVGS